jgi:acyl carrier protein
VKINSGKDGRAALVEIHVLNDQGELLAEVKSLELRNTLNLTSTKQSNTAAGAAGKVSTSLSSKSRAQLIEFMRPLSRQERIAELVNWLTIEIKDTMGQAAEGLNLDSLPPSTIFLEIGLDSLLVTELQRRIQEKLEFRFKPMQGLNYQSVETLAGFIYDEVLSVDLEAAVPAASS